ncbi:MAG: arylsulfatase [Planctomycetota bacterium]
MAASAQRPNVLVILTDDQGFGDCSCHGNPVLQTPHMDALAVEGVSFDQFHVTPMCAPTRGAFLSGVHPLRNMALSTTDGRHCLRPDLPCLPQAFADAGYRTALFGKWHQGRNWPNRPQDKGFHHLRGFYGFGTTGISCHWDCDYQDPWLVDETGREFQATGFCTDVFFDEAMDWITADEAPFFGVIATNAPHFPFWAPQELADRFRHTDNPEFFGMMANLDDNLGRIEAFLAERGLREDTIVLFFSDNGPVGGASTFTAGLRGNKGTPWEGGHRVPLWMRWPRGGIIGGRLIEGLCVVEDLFPTLLGLCAVPRPETARFDGIDLSDVLRAQEPVPDRQLVVQIDRGRLDPKTACIMRRHWRLLWCDSLYDVERDPGQEHNVVRQHPGAFTDLWCDYQQWYGERVQAAEERLPEHIGHPAQDLVILDSSEALAGTDGQPGVRSGVAGRRDGGQGPWSVEAHRSGRYEILLRRWPRESGLALTAGCPPFQTRCSGPALPAGVAFPIAQAVLAVDGYPRTAAIGADSTGIRFEIDLTAGRHEICGNFHDADGHQLCPAYYAEIRYCA